MTKIVEAKIPSEESIVLMNQLKIYKTPPAGSVIIAFKCSDKLRGTSSRKLVAYMIIYPSNEIIIRHIGMKLSKLSISKLYSYRHIDTETDISYYLYI